VKREVDGNHEYVPSDNGRASSKMREDHERISKVLKDDLRDRVVTRGNNHHQAPRISFAHTQGYHPSTIVKEDHHRDVIRAGEHHFKP